MPPIAPAAPAAPVALVAVSCCQRDLVLLLMSRSETLICIHPACRLKIKYEVEPEIETYLSHPGLTFWQS
jgi:hypothetical protein